MKSLFPVIHFKIDHNLTSSTPQFHSKISCPLHYNHKVEISRDFQTNTARYTRSNQPNTDLVLQETRYKKEDSNPHVHLFIPSTHHKVGENEREKYMRRETQRLKPQKIYPLSLADKLFSDRPSPRRTATTTTNNRLPPLNHPANRLAKRCLPQPASTARYLPRSGEKGSRQKKKDIHTEGDGDV